MKKKLVKDTTANVQPVKQCLPIYGLWGILLLFVFGSVAYSTYMVAVGTTGIVPKVMLVPQATFAIILAILKFYSK